MSPRHLLSPQFALGAKDATQSGEGLASTSEEGLRSEALYEPATVAHACHPSPQKKEAGGWEIKAMPGYPDRARKKDMIRYGRPLTSTHIRDVISQLSSWPAATSLDHPLSCSLPVSGYKVKRLALQASFEFISSRGCHSLS